MTIKEKTGFVRMPPLSFDSTRLETGNGSVSRQSSECPSDPTLTWTMVGRLNITLR